MGGHHFCPCSFGCCFDAAVGITFTPLVARMIKNDNLFCSGIEALFDDFGYELGVGIGAHFGGLIPTDVGFYAYFVASFYKVSHSSHFGDGLAEHDFRFAPHHSHQIVFTGCVGCLKRLLKDAHCFRILNGG